LFLSFFGGFNLSGGRRGDFLNAEGAKVAQRAQKKMKRIQKEDKMKTKKTKILSFKRYAQYLFIFLVFILYFLFCALCETFAPSAFKKCISPALKNGLLSKVSPDFNGH
jgi:hypothetical protein